jgi:hypothetical protein
MSIALKCITDVTEKIETLRDFDNKIFHVYSEEDLLDKAKTLSLPAVGISYGGIITEAGQDRTRMGLMGSLRVAVVLVIDANTISLDRKDEAAEYMDSIRGTLIGKSSPTCHKWQFVSETPLGQVGGVLLYMQRWQTPTPLTN